MHQELTDTQLKSYGGNEYSGLDPSPPWGTFITYHLRGELSLHNLVKSGVTCTKFGNT